MDNISKILDSVITKKNFYIKIKGNIALLKWDKIVGDKLAKFTTPLYYREGILYVGVVSSLFMRELTAIKGMILEKIQKEVGESPIHDLRFRVIENRIKKRKEYISETSEVDFSDIKLSPSDLKWVEELVNKLKADEKTKEKFSELLILYKKNEKLREKLGYKRCKKCKVLFKGKGDLCPICSVNDKK